MRHQKGFTIIELSISIAIIAILGAIGTTKYNQHTAKSQVTEAFTLFDGGKTTIQNNLQSGACTSQDASKNTANGRYGTMTISGTPTANSTDTFIGCIMTYNFAKNGVSSNLSGKKIVSNVTKQQVLSKDDATTVEKNYLPESFIKIQENTVSNNSNVFEGKTWADIQKMPTVSGSFAAYSFDYGDYKGSSISFVSGANKIGSSYRYLYATDVADLDRAIYDAISILGRCPTINEITSYAEINPTKINNNPGTLALKSVEMFKNSYICK